MSPVEGRRQAMKLNSETVSEVRVTMSRVLQLASSGPTTLQICHVAADTATSA